MKLCVLGAIGRKDDIIFSCDLSLLNVCINWKRNVFTWTTSFGCNI